MPKKRTTTRGRQGAGQDLLAEGGVVTLE
jgi:hypothetical protein